MLRLNKIVCFISVPVYLAVIISPAQIWIAGFAALLIPAMLALHVVFLGFWLLKRKLYVFLSFLLLLLGLPFIKATFNFSTSAYDRSDSDLSVLSYNVRVFNIYHYWDTRDRTPTQQTISWIQRDDSDIKCLQEYYQETYSDDLYIAKKLEQKGKYQSFTHCTFSSVAGQEFGVAIFSRFQILDTGSLYFQTGMNNTAIYADIQINKDTARIINAHLASMSIDMNRWTFLGMFKRIKQGFQTRALQTEVLANFIAKSPYPVILCADLNDTPYSYTYNKLRQSLANAFERVGKGFGFTYNHPYLSFLRIDHQFYDKKFFPVSYKNHQVSFTDHFPLKVSYRIKD